MPLSLRGVPTCRDDAAIYIKDCFGRLSSLAMTAKFMNYFSAQIINVIILAVLVGVVINIGQRADGKCKT